MVPPKDKTKLNQVIVVQPEDKTNLNQVNNGATQGQNQP